MNPRDGNDAYLQSPLRTKAAQWQGGVRLGSAAAEGSS